MSKGTGQKPKLDRVSDDRRGMLKRKRKRNLLLPSALIVVLLISISLVATFIKNFSKNDAPVDDADLHFMGNKEALKLNKNGQPTFQSSQALQEVTLKKPAQDFTISEILAKHVTAYGGWKNLNRVESIRLSGEITREGSSSPIVILKKRTNKIRATITVPSPWDNNLFIQSIRGYDGNQGWMSTRVAGTMDHERSLLKENQETELYVESGVTNLLIKLQQDNALMELENIQPFQQQECWKIKASFKNKSKEFMLYISTKSFALLGYDITHSDKTSTRVIYDNFISQSGVIIPRKLTTINEATGQTSFIAQNIDVGIGIHREYF